MKLPVLDLPGDCSIIYASGNEIIRFWYQSICQAFSGCCYVMDIPYSGNEEGVLYMKKCCSWFPYLLTFQKARPWNI